MGWPVVTPPAERAAGIPPLVRTLQAGDGSTSGVGLFEVTNAALLVPAAPAVTEVGYVGQLSPDQLMWELSILLDGLLDPPPPPRRAQDGLHRA